jgi:drug/metabolite transporter (DMT)-like permease
MRDQQQHWRAPAIVAAADESRTPAGTTTATPHPDRRAKIRDLFLLLFGGSVWGVTFSLAKIATAGGAHPLGITLWQAVFGAIFLLCFMLARRRPLPMGRRFLAFYLVCGLLGTAVPSSLFFYAAAHVPAGVLAITIASVPILTFAAALAFRLDRMAVRRVLGVLLGMLAVVLMMAPESGQPEASATPWILVAVLASACYAAENVYIALRRPSGCDAYTILCGMLLVAALVLAPVVIATHSFVPLSWPLGGVELAIIGMAAINVVAYGLFIYLVTSAGPVFASQMAYVVTLSGIVWGIAIFGEQHSLWIWAALAAMMAALILVTPRARS